MKYYAYGYQDGMYCTEQIILTDEFKSNDDLPPYWGVVDYSDKSYSEII